MNKMKCPYCGVEMTPGVILGYKYSLTWSDGDQGSLFGYNLASSFIIGESTVFVRPKVKGYICRGCKKIIVDY